MAAPWQSDPVASSQPWSSDPVAGNAVVFDEKGIAERRSQPNTRVVYMAPDRLLSLGEPLGPDWKSDDKGKSVAESLAKGESFHDIPVVVVDRSGRAMFQDGRHRAAAAKESGMDTIPVAIVGDISGVSDIRSPSGEKIPVTELGLPTPKPSPIRAQLARDPTADTVLGLLSGMVAGPVSGIAGLAGSVLPGPQGQGAAWVRRAQEALTYEPQTKEGQVVTAAAAYPFEKIANLADIAGGKVTDITGMPAAGAAVNTAIQAAPMLAGKVLKGDTPAAQAERATLKGQNTIADIAAHKAQSEGLALPPSQVNPSLINKAIEGAAGKIKTAQDLSRLNQPKLNSMIRRAFGLPEDTALSVDVMANVRREAGQAYEAVRGEGRMNTDGAYRSEINAAVEPYVRAASDFPKAARKDIIDAARAIKVDSFDASSAVDQIRVLREKADTAFRNGDGGLGRTYKQLAGAIEGQIERFLEYVQAPFDMLQNFRDARRTIAASYTVQKHLRPNGNIDAKGLAGELQRGKPLSGGVRDVAEFGGSFPKAAQLPEKVGGVPMSPLDYAISLGSLGGAIASGQPTVALGAALPFLRPALRNIIAGPTYQDAFVHPPSYGVPLTTRLADIQRLPATGIAEMSLGQPKQ